MKKLVTKTESRKAKKRKVKRNANISAQMFPHKDKPSKAKASKAKGNGNASKPSKASRKGGGKALTDFGNASKLRVLNGKEIPSRSACFKTGQTVSACLAAQKAKGFRGRRKFIRAQVSQGRVSLS